MKSKKELEIIARKIVEANESEIDFFIDAEGIKDAVTLALICVQDETLRSMQPISDAQKEELKRLYLENSKLSEKIDYIGEANQIYRCALQNLIGDKWAATQLCKNLEHDGGSYYVGQYCEEALKEAEARILGGTK